MTEEFGCWSPWSSGWWVRVISVSQGSSQATSQRKWMCAKVWRWQKGNERQLDKRWIAVRFHRAVWRDRTVARSWDVGNCNSTRLREMNINYTWRMISGLQGVSYNPRRRNAHHWWQFTEDYNPTHYCSPKANNNLRESAQLLKCFPLYVQT